MGKWKGIRKNIQKEKNLDIALYNLEVDKGETHDVAGEYPDVADKIRNIMQSARTESTHDAFKMEILNN
ncbi:hypothetical protein J6I44_07160 [Aliifodinibius sp. 1BSP15-2V2]|uniref:Uncharacterized protein n=2 Tax=Fodinibius salsisoli TaxID=2820877 RepID=A0ABT3PLM3_9BACT|nr:hypothetical protein [Fodinibius salsisoli]MCW9706628.1 hypothetical protein [Fodinibius salsisoli]